MLVRINGARRSAAFRGAVNGNTDGVLIYETIRRIARLMDEFIDIRLAAHNDQTFRAVKNIIGVG